MYHSGRTPPSRTSHRSHPFLYETGQRRRHRHEYMRYRDESIVTTSDEDRAPQREFHQSRHVERIRRDFAVRSGVHPREANVDREQLHWRYKEDHPKTGQYTPSMKTDISKPFFARQRQTYGAHQNGNGRRPKAVLEECSSTSKNCNKLHLKAALPLFTISEMLVVCVRL